MTYIELLPGQIHSIMEEATGEKIKSIEYQFNQVHVSDPVCLYKIKLIIDKANIKRENNAKKEDKE
jgi:hypothetical protein